MMVFSFTALYSQQKTTQVKITAVVTDSLMRVNVNRDVKVMLKATMEENFELAVKYMHPLIVQMMGGAVKTAYHLKQEVVTMKADGFTISDVEIEQPGKIVPAGTEYYCVIPEKVIISYRNKRLYNNSSILGVSTDYGRNWRFIDAGGMTDEQIKQYLPEIAGKLNIPKRSETRELND